jgi:hypothetical protein
VVSNDDDDDDVRGYGQRDGGLDVECSGWERIKDGGNGQRGLPSPAVFPARPGCARPPPPLPLPSSSTPPTPLIPSVDAPTTGSTLDRSIYRSMSQIKPAHACTTAPAVRHHDQLQNDAQNQCIQCTQTGVKE